MEDSFPSGSAVDRRQVMIYLLGKVSPLAICDAMCERCAFSRIKSHESGELLYPLNNICA
jgi:hypothetical protein